MLDEVPDVGGLDWTLQSKSLAHFCPDHWQDSFRQRKNRGLTHVTNDQAASSPGLSASLGLQRISPVDCSSGTDLSLGNLVEFSLSLL
jgi:hypothetical protein